MKHQQKPGIGQIRIGSGKYEDGEKGIKDVELNFTENSGSGKVYTAKTDENGDFLIEGYIPGNYTLTYTWGDQTYTVQSYKGTIYDNSRNQNDKSWYKEDVATRYSDAIDNYNKDQEAPKGSRLQIDAEVIEVTKDTKNSLTRHKMDATTPTMGMTIENVKNISEYITTSSDGDELKYKVENVDFGIVERARQNIELKKRVKTMKITLANGQILTNIEIDEKGNLTGDTSNLTYMAPNANAIPKNGYLKVELDNELIQGSTLEVEYVIVATNNSELDYATENYYKYGTDRRNTVTITPTGIVDYLDKDWAFDEKLNPEWTLKTLDEIKDMVVEEVYNSEQSTIKEKLILYTDALAKMPLEPTKSEEVTLKVSKQLSTTDEISLDNETEIVKLTKTGGGLGFNYTPGNYVPGTGKTEIDDDMSETTMVTPATGENQNYIIPITVGIIALIILGSGIVVIKKKIVDKNS